MILHHGFLGVTLLMSFVFCELSERDDKKEEVEIDSAMDRHPGLDISVDLSPNHNLSSLTQSFSQRSAPPRAYDWRKDYRYNVLPPAENQVPCSTCWIFSTLYMLEAQYAIKTGRVVSFSKQQLVDCIHSSQGLGGCYGWGTMQMVFEYVKQRSIQSTRSYGPYLGNDGTCRYNPKKVIASVSGDLITFTGEEAFLKILYHRGPIGAVMISPKTYDGGIMSTKGVQCPEKIHPINHMVLIVGYGVTPRGLKYWIAKNTYGTEWGIQGGYFKIERGRNTLCIEKLGVIANIVA